jgi:hypothetical protein
MVYDKQKHIPIRDNCHIDDTNLSCVAGRSAQQPGQAKGCQSDMIGGELLSSQIRKQKHKKTKRQ